MTTEDYIAGPLNVYVYIYTYARCAEGCIEYKFIDIVYKYKYI